MEIEGENIIVQRQPSKDDNDIIGSLLGLKRNTLEEVYELYCSHARAVGFSVRKSTSRSNMGVKIEGNYVCSTTGFKKGNDSNGLISFDADEVSSLSVKKERKVPITRTGCQALLRAKLNSEGLYEVINHSLDHNHVLTRKEWGHLHHSERMMTEEKAEMIKEMTSSGLKHTDSYRYMAHDAGGEECLGHTLKDHLNFVNHLKMNAIEGGDAQTLLDVLYQRASEDINFFFKVKLDDEGKVCNVFWRDSMMSEDFEIYGDVVVFDTTYRTNRYNLICPPFVGINNHWKNVMFGCAFLADEKTESFEWLFENFKKSMRGKCPMTLFTDQDQAISNVIEKVFSGTRHRLCLWHLHQNAVSRFGKLKSDNSFIDIFNKCLKNCVDQDEFESCWKVMVSKYGLQNHSWFKRLYDLREKWCTALNKDYFSAGILSSQRSESTNNAIGFNAKKTTSLTEFYGILNEILKRWRSKEEYDEFQSSRSNPTSDFPVAGMLQHASKVYTLTLFKNFNEEFCKCISACSRIVLIEESMFVYEVSYVGEDRIFRVIFDSFRNLITCSCKKFEECGWLCSHCLRVLHVHSIVQIPDCYILKMWTKSAKSEVWDRFNNTNGKSKDYIPWRHERAHKFYNFLLKYEGNDEARKVIDNRLDYLMTSLDTNVQSEMLEVSTASNGIFDPERSVTKGRSKRIKGYFQKKGKKRNKQILGTDKELGSSTPNPCLF